MITSHMQYHNVRQPIALHFSPTTVMDGHPEVKDAIDALRRAEYQLKTGIHEYAKGRHAAWRDAVAKLPVGSVQPAEPSATPTEGEIRHAEIIVTEADSTLKAALATAHADLASDYREREAQLLAEVREITSRLTEIGEEVQALIRDVTWIERVSDQRVSVPQTSPHMSTELLMDVANGGKHTHTGTFFQNI